MRWGMFVTGNQMRHMRVWWGQTSHSEGQPFYVWFGENVLIASNIIQGVL